jgi:hypothetical protein
MKRSKFSILYATAVFLASWMAEPAATADHSEQREGRQRLSVTASFGAGLNTTGIVNQHIMPPVIRVSSTGVVNFVVSRVHQIFVYSPGKGVDDVVLPPPGTTFINDRDGLYYEGIAPTGTPPPGISNLQNRVEPVAFSDPGTYLVICNITGHFLNGMYAWVVVTDDEPEGGHDHDGGHDHQDHGR